MRKKFEVKNNAWVLFKGLYFKIQVPSKQTHIFMTGDLASIIHVELEKIQNGGFKKQK